MNARRTEGSLRRRRDAILSPMGTLRDCPGVLALGFCSAALAQPPATTSAPPVAAGEQLGLKVRAGYEVTVAVEKLDNARFMEFDDKGTLYVSRPNRGDVISLRDKDGDGVYETRATFISGLKLPHGLCFRDGFLWIAPSRGILRGRDTDGDGVADEKIVVIPDGQLPGGDGHWWRSLLVVEDGFYSSVGDPGNITDQTETEREKIWKFSLDGQTKTLFCSGIRNTEKLRIRPGTTEIWGVDHGSDNFGGPLGEKPPKFQPLTDYNPPDELNHYVEGGFYGHPFIVGNRVPRFEFTKREDILDLAARTTPPEWCFGAHWANNGFCFIDPAVNDKTGAFPRDHNGDLFVAFHGSWNRSEPAGYCVARVLFDDGHPYGMLKVVEGLNAKREVTARPVDCVQAPDGSVLFSDDFRGRILRIRHAPPAK